MSIIGGVIAGILGFTGLMGFVVYVLVMAITSVCLTAKAGFSIRSYFDSWNRVLLDGFLGGALVKIFIPVNCALNALTLSSRMYINEPTMSFPLQSFVLFWTYPFILGLSYCVTLSMKNPYDEIVM